MLPNRRLELTQEPVAVSDVRSGLAILGILVGVRDKAGMAPQLRRSWLTPFPGEPFRKLSRTAIDAITGLLPRLTGRRDLNIIHSLQQFIANMSQGGENVISG